MTSKNSEPGVAHQPPPVSFILTPRHPRPRRGLPYNGPDTVPRRRLAFKTIRTIRPTMTRPASTAVTSML